MISNKTYDFLKWIAQIALPAFGTLYFGLASIWGLPYGEQIIGSIASINTFLGVLLGISKAQYNKIGGDGIMHVDTSDPDVDRYRLELNTVLDDLTDKQKLDIKVQKDNSQE